MYSDADSFVTMYSTNTAQREEGVRDLGDSGQKIDLNIWIGQLLFLRTCVHSLRGRRFLRCKIVSLDYINFGPFHTLTFDEKV